MYRTLIMLSLMISGTFACSCQVKSAYLKKPTGPNTAAYMLLENASEKEDHLKNAKVVVKVNGESKDLAGRIELHDHIMEGNVAKMREVDAIAVPAKGSSELKPGGKHVMLFDVRNELLTPGAQVVATLEFDSGTQDVVLPISVPPLAN